MPATNGRFYRFVLSAALTFATLAALGVTTYVYAVCTTQSYSVTSSAPPPIGNWTDTSGALWSPPGGFPGCAPGDTAADTNGSPTTLIINSIIPNPIAGLNLACAGCMIDIQSGGSLTLAGNGSTSSASSIVVEPGGNLFIQSGTLTIGSGSSLSVNGGFVDVEPGAQLDLQGASTVTNLGTLAVSGTMTVSNTLTVQSTGTISLNGATVNGTSTINNSGTVTQNGSDSSISAIFKNQSGGSVTVSSGKLSLSGGGTGDAPFTISGGTLDFPSGAYVTTANGTISGAGTLSVTGGTLTIGGVTSPSNYTMTAGTLNGTGFLDVTGVWNWSGGTVAASGGMQLAGGGTANWDASLANIIVDAQKLDVYGYANYTATTNALYLNNGAMLNVYGTFDFQADGSVEAGTPPDTMNVAPNGFVVKSAGTGTSTIFPNFNNSSNLAVYSGTLNINGSGTDTGFFFDDTNTTIVFSAASTSCGCGILTNGNVSFPSGTFTMSGSMSVGSKTSITGAVVNINTASVDTTDFLLDGGTLNLSGDFLMSGNGTWSSGTIAGSSTFDVESGATMTIDAANGICSLEGAEFDNDGTTNYTATVASTNYLQLINGLIVNDNNDLFDVQTDQPINVGILVATAKLPPSVQAARRAKLKMKNDAVLIGSSTIRNNGTFRKSAGTGTTDVFPDFGNAGTMNALTGTLNFHGTYDQTAGSTNLAGGNITMTGSPLTLDGGTLDGAGTITGDVQNNSGTVAPGDASTLATINIAGNYTQASGGTTSMKIGPASGQQDVVSTSNAATLDGNFTATLLNAPPPNGAAFTVLTFATRTGDFATYTLPSDPFGSIQSSYTPTSLVLSVATAQTDLSAGMTGPAAINAASALSYDVTITNNGPNTATGTITVVDTLPAAVASASGAGTGWSCGAPSGGTITCTNGTSLASGASLPALTFSMTAPSNGGTISNSATVSNATDPNAANNTASVSTSVVAHADLGITKSGPAGVTSGQNVVYTVTVTNNGPSPATNVTVSDPPPANLTFVSNSGNCTSAYPCSLGTLASGQSATITSTYSTSATFSGNVTNTATVSATENDPNNTNNSASMTTNVGAQADLAITKTGPATATPGSNVSYTVTVTNNGPSPATSVVVNDTTPTGIAFVSNSGGCTTAYPCSLVTLNAGQSVTITSTYTVPGTFTAPSFSNTASVSSNVNDPTPSNNSATATTNVTQQTDLAITKSGPPSANPGANIVYTITVSNLGPSIAGNVTVTDPTPAGLTFVSNSGGCTTAFPCNAGILNPGQTATITSTFSIPANYSGTSVTNTASVSSTANDPNATNDSANVTTPVGIQGDVGITKSGPASVGVGQNAVYTIVVTNNGSVAANNVFVTDPTPAGTTFVSNSGGCTSTFPCALGTIAAGQSVTITSTFNVPQTYAGSTVTNTAGVSTSTPDGNPSNDSATAVTPVSSTRVADLSITKTGPATGVAVVGSNVTFTVTVFNSGPNVANNVVISDPASVGLTFVSNSGGCTTAWPCTIPSLGVGSFVTIHSTYTVNGFARSTATNTATVTSSATDPNPGNNTASASVRTTPLPACPAAGPTLTAPVQGASTLSPVNFSWSTVPHATSYTLTVTPNAGGTPVSVTTTITSATLTFTGGSYSWFVVAQGASNCQSVGSTTSSFFVCSPPAAPLAMIIGEASTGQGFSVLWSAVDGAGGYELQEAGDAAFTNPTTFTVNDVSKAFTKFVTVPTPFYYRVRAVSLCNSFVSPYSDAIRIVVIPVGDGKTPGGPSANAPAGSTQPITFPVFVPGLPGGTTSFVATVDKPWLSVTPTSGLVPPEGITLTITADPTGLTNGTWTGTVLIVYGNVTISGARFAPDATTTTSVPVSINLVTPVAPGKLGTPSANALIIPSVGHLSGASSEWRSDVRVANPSSNSQQFAMTFNDGTSIKNTTITVDAGATVALDDIVRNWFGIGSLGDSGNGTLTLDPIGAGRRVVPDDVSKTTSSVVTSRTYNAATNGTLGQYIPAVPFLNFIGTTSTSSKLFLQQIAQSAAYRTNVGVVESAGKPASVVVSTFDGGGNKLFDLPLSLAAGEQKQLNAFLTQNGVTTLTNGHIEVTSASGDGKVTAYASVVDNATNDPFLVSGVTLGSGASRFIVPGIADLNSGTASWRSDVRIFNGSASPQTATLTFYPLGNASAASTQTVSINPGEVKALDNIVQTTFGASNVGGTLHITTAAATPLVVSARTFDQTSSGTLGQFIPATTLNDAVGNGDRALQLVQMEDSPRYRTNLGIAEVNGQPATVTVSVFLPASKVAPSATFTLPAYGSMQVPILTSLGLGNTYNARIAVRVVGGDGKVTAYGSVIDQKTQAPVFVPAQ